MARPAVVVDGLRELQTALARADRDTRLGVRAELREAAEPVRRDAELLADRQISNIGRRWQTMRVGITRTSVYVAPRRRGVRRGDPASRPNLAPLLAGQAMEPALDKNETETVRAMERLLDRVADRFNRELI